MALLVFGTMQMYGLCELIGRWRIKLGYEKRYEDVVQKAIENPENQHYRTLLVDLASTHLDDLGERLPVRDWAEMHNVGRD